MKKAEKKNGRILELEHEPLDQKSAEKMTSKALKEIRKLDETGAITFVSVSTGKTLVKVHRRHIELPDQTAGDIEKEINKD